MKRYLNQMICCISLFLIVTTGCNREDPDVIGGTTILEKDNVTFTASKDSVTLKAVSDEFVCFYEITSIQNEDTTSQYFEYSFDERAVSGDWYQVKTENVTKTDNFTEAIKISAEANNTGKERKLIILLWCYDSLDTLVITQEAK